jgi:hypothetical protein
MQISWHSPFAVVSTIERLEEEGEEHQTFAPPRLPLPQNTDSLFSTNKKPMVSLFHNLFAFNLEKPPSLALERNQDSSHERIMPSSFCDPFTFNHTSSNLSSVPTQIKALPHSVHNTFAFNSSSFSLPHNVVIPNTQQQLHTDSSSSHFFNPFIFGSHSNFPNRTAPASASHKQQSSLTLSSSLLINSNTTDSNIISNPPIFCSRPNITSPACLQLSPDTPISSPCRQPAPRRAISHNMLRLHVPAANRLFSWRTPHGINEDNRILERLPIQLAEAARLSIMGAFAPSSHLTYGAGIL